MTAPAPIDDAGEQHYPLAEAAARFFPGGLITKRSLMTEIHKGRLQAIQIAGKFLVSESAISALKKAAAFEAKPKAKAPWPDPQSQPASTCAAPQDAPPSGSSSTTAGKSALAAARQTMAELKSNSTPTSGGRTNRRPARVHSTPS